MKKWEEICGHKVDPLKPICLHEQMDNADPKHAGMPRMLSCPCPRCSPTCM